MTIVTENYNGWTNWETWNVNLWLTNDENAYDWLTSAAKSAIATDPDDDDNQERILADYLRDEVPNTGIVGDSVSWHRVDWRAIAQAALEDK